MTAVFKKEIRTYYTSMTGYIFLGFLVFISALYFGIINVRGHYANYAHVLSGTTIVFLIIIPTITMRLFSEETRQKTDQLLFTAPVSVFRIVIGKYMAALTLFLTGMAVTLLFPLALSRFGEIPVSQIAGAYIGYILLGACFIAVGLFVSVLTDSQVIAAIGTFGALFIFYLLDGLTANMPTDRVTSLVFVILCIVGIAYLVYNGTNNIYAGIVTALVCLTGSALALLWNNYIFDGAIIKVMSWFSLLKRFDNFTAGVLAASDVIYYITFSLVFIFLTKYTVEKRRWS